MSPEDPRHGTRRGYYVHRRDNEEACTDCKRGAATAEVRCQMARDRGITQRIDPTGTRRRLQALCALGWTMRQIDNELGVQNLASKWVNEDRQYVYATTAVKIAALYDRLSMTFPPETTSTERGNAVRARNLARRRGWPPPLAWDQIDNPSETPRGWQYEAAPIRSRAEILADLDEQHAGISTVTRALKIKREAVEKWCERHGQRDLYERLLAREQPYRWANQYREGGAA